MSDAFQQRLLALLTSIKCENNQAFTSALQSSGTSPEVIIPKSSPEISATSNVLQAHHHEVSGSLKFLLFWAVLLVGIGLGCLCTQIYYDYE